MTSITRQRVIAAFIILLAAALLPAGCGRTGGNKLPKDHAGLIAQAYETAADITQNSGFGSECRFTDSL